MRDFIARILISRIGIIFLLFILVLSLFAGYSVLSRQKAPQPEYVCGGKNCFAGCCVRGKCQQKGINIAGYTCFGENKWETPDKKGIASGTPYAVIDAVTGKSSVPDPDDPATVVATVGQERIFQKDLDSEISLYPPQYSPDIRKILIDKISEDSTLLQKAAKEGDVVLDETVFDTVDKDYSKRLELVKEVKGIFDSRQNSLSGTIISIWFYNEKIGPLGYEKGKQLAFQKIDALQRNVKNGNLTLEEAVDIIKNDRELEQIDKSYKSNASFRFDVREGQKISLDPGFDSQLWQLSDGDVSDVFLAKDIPEYDAPAVDAVYMFARIDRRQIAETVKEQNL
ncbi:MAG: hypothetical protein UV73_C0006G0009 [Candidatus Gottesmanbacteria bacterium GW2011_GWA2_43_14]|uniref:Uncharacterized protein n=1 Tax=Candidatus Gottesmanbacteria bacterium GW2011_GWA2_43_14 TaxID=1618443 RepID=A0A0G1DIJ9_9BACT|nr:MAG: hypothetical protein UV73_C0006G0009 [Candidatus Gottesmanbacteria bacterium GW2011_GWA2_43_14]